MCMYMTLCVLILVLYIYHIHTMPLLIINGVYVRDSAVCGICTTRHIVIDVHHWNSTFQLTASVYTFLCMVSIALLIVAAEAVTARLAGSD